MPDSLEVLIARRDALQAARMSGVLTVEYDNRRLTYKSDRDMAAALAALEREIAAAETGAPPSRIVLTAAHKGL